MVKMQGTEDEGAGSVLKYMTKPESDSNAADWPLWHADLLTVQPSRLDSLACPGLRARWALSPSSSRQSAPPAGAALKERQKPFSVEVNAVCSKAIDSKSILAWKAILWVTSGCSPGIADGKKRLAWKAVRPRRWQRLFLGFVTFSFGSVTFSRRLVTYRPSGGKLTVPRAVNLPSLGR